MLAAEVVFRPGRLTLRGTELCYLESGAGKPLVVLVGSLAAPARGLELLADRCRVVLLEVGAPEAESRNGQAGPIAAVAEAARQIAGGPFALLGAADQARLALRVATEAAADVASLILVAPEEPIEGELRSELAALMLPVLVVHGTEDHVTPPEQAREYAAVLPAAFFMLVYDAGHAIDRDRPEAFASLLGDFVTLGGREFLAPPESTLINP